MNLPKIAVEWARDGALRCWECALVIAAPNDDDTVLASALCWLDPGQDPAAMRPVDLLERLLRGWSEAPIREGQ